MPIDFYYIPGSAPCRTVLLTARAVGVEMNNKLTNLQEKEHLTPEFTKMNPQHCVPTINDEGLVLWESRAIAAYLVNQYGKDDALYSKNPKKRAMIDQRLHFDLGTLYQRFGDLYYPVMFGGAALDQGKKAKLEEAFQLLDKFLDGQKWVAGDAMTIADFAIVSTVSTCDAVRFDLSKYPNVSSWYERAKKEIPGYQELNQSGADLFKTMYEKLANV